jgi:antitoxin (DNA-binding transcriptional repressor) of toxin-antitoxin stability system
MRQIGIRELKNSATQLISTNETLVIQRRGKPVGVYVPLQSPSAAERKELLDRLEKITARVQKRTGLSEEALVRMLSWK